MQVKEIDKLAEYYLFLRKKVGDSNLKSLKCWVTGGYFDDSGEGFVYEIDVWKSTVSEIIRYTPPNHLLVPRKGFTGGAWHGLPGQSDFFVCGFCALFRFSPPNWNLSGVLHQPCMNDLHAVAVHDQHIFLANTGLESIDIFNTSGNFSGSHSFQPSWLNKERQNGISPSTDDWSEFINMGWKEKKSQLINNPTNEEYYQSDKNSFHQKPVRDYYHLNHVSLLSENYLLATSLSHRCVYDIRNFKKVIENVPGYPHDGLIKDNIFWLTCVEGRVLGYEIKEGILTSNLLHNINIFGSVDFHGWCRGILIQNDFILLGITEIRRKPQFDWNVSSWESTKTGIIIWDLKNSRFADFIDLSEKRHSKIFSILESGN